MAEFASKNVLVTGANTNTGFAIARSFAQQGARVFLNGRNDEAVQAAAKSLGDQVTGLTADLCDPKNIDAMFAQLATHTDRLDVLVNNACHLGSFKSFLDMTLEEFESVLAVNLRASFCTCQHAAKLMVKQRGGTIVNLSSNTSQQPIRDRSDYIAAKGGLEAMTRAMALELGKHKIRVNIVSPGYIHTDRWDVLPPEVCKRRRDNLPLGDEATMDDIADAVCFLAGSKSRSITGTILTVDAGASIQLVPMDCEV